MTEIEDHSREWHLDKRVPITLIVAILIQSAAAIWWVSTYSTKTDQRLKHVEEQLRMVSGSQSRIARLEQSADSQSAALIRIEAKLDRVIEREKQP